MANVVVKFLGDKTQLSKTIKGAKQETAGLGGASAKAGASAMVLAGGAVAVGAALFKMLNTAGETADQLFDMHDQTGIATDKLQEMRHVATQAGVSQDFYANSVKEVIKAQDELQRGTGPASEALETLGVAVSNADGSMRSAEAITDETIERLQAIEDPTLRAALAQDVFKRKYEDLLPVLGLGTDAMEDLREEAHELGVVQSGEALTAANEYRKGMERIKGAVQGLVNEGMAVLIPILVDDFIPALEGVIDIAGIAAEGLGSLTGSLEESVPWFVDVLQRANPLGFALAELGEYAGDAAEGTGTLTGMLEGAASVGHDFAISQAAIKSSTDEATAAVKSQAEEIRKATDPAFALMKADEALVEASDKVDSMRREGKGNTADFIQALADEAEAQGDANYAAEQFEAAGAAGARGLAELQEQAGHTRDEIDLLNSALQRMHELSGNLAISIDVQTDLRGLYSELAKFGSGQQRPI